VYDPGMADPAARLRSARTESREVAELRALRARHPELGDAVDMHLELLDLQRRVQGRISLPWLELSNDILVRHQATGEPILGFDLIPLDLTDLRLVVRQTADVLRRFGALEDPDYRRAQALGRDMKLMAVISQWYRSPMQQRALAVVGLGSTLPPPPSSEDDGFVTQVLTLAMRPFLGRCAEAVQQRPELAIWTHAYCALCGGEPDFAVITPVAERHLICGRCMLRWKFAPLACPYCHNDQRDRITSFATADGRYRVYACEVCRRYLKAYDSRHATRPVMPVADNVATLALDAAAMQRGYS
jgi:hypothetical protein